MEQHEQHEQHEHHKHHAHQHHQKRNYIKVEEKSVHLPSHIQEKSSGVKRALLIGINYIGSDYKLNGCIQDIHNMKDLIINKFGYHTDNITILSDDQHNKPTKSHILENVQKCVASTKSGDELFIHYSGHGTQVACTSGDESSNADTPGQDDAICPCDFYKFKDDTGFIVDDELKEILVNQVPVGAKLRVFFDCCHSGSALDLPFLYKSGNIFQKVEPLDKLSPDCLLISGCRDDQTSADAYINGKYSGALTWALLKALNTKAPTSWKDLLILIRHYLADGGYDQVPMLSVGDQSIANLNIDL
jgi:metacaspase-1